MPRNKGHNMSEIRRGSSAIQEAADSSKGGGDWRPFVPAIYWKEDKEERYVLFLNEIEEIPLFDLISFIPTENGFFSEVVAKTDQFFGEKDDEFIPSVAADGVRPAHTSYHALRHHLKEVVANRMSQ